MTNPVPTAAAVPAARILHLAMLASVLLLTAAAYVVRSRMAAVPTVPPTFRFVLLSAGLTTGALSLLIRTRILPRAPASDAAEWWRANLRRAVLVWALFDAAAGLGAMAHLLTGEVVVYGLLAGGALAGLLLFTPGRLSGD